MGPVDTLDGVLQEVRRRRTPYPLGSGEAEEIALRAGIKPLVRQTLNASAVDAAAERYRREGLCVAVAPVRYAHRAGARRSFAVGDAPPDSQAPVFVSRSPEVAQAAADCEVADRDDQARTMGGLLGYPPCCIDAFVATPRPRPNRELAARALARTTTPPHPRLNTLDQAVFHYVAYSPCTLDCEPSLRFAEAVAGMVRRQHPAFASAIDAALGAHRIMVSDAVQVSLTGAVTPGGIEIDRVWPTAMDRHPRATLASDDEREVAELTLRLRRGRVLRDGPGGPMLDGAQLVPAPRGALLVPFGR
jgi:hypothetical protein